MWLGRCTCGRDINVPRGLFEAIVRVRAFLQRQRLGPQPFQPSGHWAYGVIGLMLGIFVGMVIGLEARPSAPPQQFYLGDFVKAEHFNGVAADLGCPQVDAYDGELLRDAMRRLDRCFEDRDARDDSH
jgi:hypothetical protein